MERPTCRECLFAYANNDTSVVCHRYPPTITSAEGYKVTSHFPLVGIDQWCGEWKTQLHA